ncbi:uncharacterized protein SPAPADRAFT_71151 [Spathaspora passalidarum NRRL Y-27907]|uniref:TAFII55 protein conserved region domain-containing protein n=1 Tax=Spathaspora passalidarum (strain NRRL Y-27907 / 11-Y1) TaxID=619300 RepID=G3ALP6_SPAPN|nr:uncharacterized protein SPAPADRAFT_71151 [Spathaspora passalidarum NRRL Y-27907]EGW33289.1 hypothetical protein SPAPADRAFT_71151 [Spathaspora passalidarum NRRL Y-27907]
MALKLKLKVPSASASNSASSAASPKETPPLPKLKIKPPSVKRPSTDDTAAPPIKKIKINLGTGTVKSSEAPRSVPRVRIKPTRVPGEGYDSEAPDLEDDPLIEQGIIIRFLNDANLDFVSNAVDSGDLTGINIKWITRDKAVININGTLYSARLIDLPTVTELYKTIDRKNIFKTFDICQILLVLHEINPAQLKHDKDFEVPPEYIFQHPFYNHVKNNEIKQKKLVFKHGLLSPFEDIYRRFRPTKADHRVMEDIESRVNELIKLDNDAEESHFELIDKKEQQLRFTSSATPSAVSTPVPLKSESEPVDEVDDIELHLEEELNKVLDEDENMFEPSGEQEEEQEEAEEESEAEEEEEEEEEEQESEEEEDEEDEEGKSGKQHVKLLEEEITELEKAVEHHKKNLATASSKMLRMKFQNTYSSLKSSLDQKKRLLAKYMEEQEQLQLKSEPNKAIVHHDDHDEDEEEEDEEEDEDKQDENLDDIDDLF